MLLTIQICVIRPQYADHNTYQVTGTIIDIDSKKRPLSFRSTYYIMSDGKSYVMSRSVIDFFDENVGDNVSFIANDMPVTKTSYIVATNKNDVVREESLKKINTNNFVCKLIGVTLVWIMGLVWLILEFWPMLGNIFKRKRSLKNRKLKHAKKQLQAEKYNSLESSTEERHIQNKNMSKKKQKRRMKQNKPSNKTK